MWHWNCWNVLALEEMAQGICLANWSDILAVQDMQRNNTVKAGSAKVARWLTHHVRQCYSSSQ